ncbi:hypothetical protein Barba22A_gp079 [Rheinheimera phage vB_RspM_Barba22A]|jgi:hypothetical protein|uniref:Uncharacterized protein n=83 Tax=Barbavirus TaxID=2733095 RepID=A0A7G9VRW1_9CAUD|nr:hypothetical protein HOV44_gp087 [Rheinheimera phage Barba5S]YP_009822819.1 hypothetical protein HOV45_gp083 [Rheinheimera phage Barba8S]YP_009822956.1 hypothetical protein HOV46_gp079 [Rheinheimera phage vB_RspM_Barba18A]YP_009823237.1 hypothetical protein HOV48_gp081 [Rheinheimera phage Barba21A]QCQ57930.1 hypothetical protein Barba1A_gp079 [Rheinheimera phage vB_RspM_Barba1A]QCQ58066.1 hypothetical protein Barba1S_gp079 [Rheinheimera phage vB_RspM_Barba1S]QCQ58202.1 hypothetical protein
MISWIKSLFKKTPPYISEPVISFVELVKNNPDRFRLNLNNEDYRGYSRNNRKCYHHMDILYDRNLKEHLPMQISFDGCNFITCIKHSYLTPDECEYIYEQLKPIFQARKDRLDLLKSKRVIRSDQRKRERDIKKYCKE